MSMQAPSFGQADLNDCHLEPIRIPASIQPHGVLLALDPNTMTVVQLAGETLRLLGRTHDELLGQSLKASLGTAALDRVEGLVSKQRLTPRPFSIIEASFEGRPLEISAYLSGGLVILELTTRRQSDYFNAIETVHAMTSRAEEAKSLPELLDIAVAEVGELTGYDRVMLYRFREDESGYVIAEHRQSEAVESFLGLHYPESDIPIQARELYCSSWSRSIPCVAYLPQPLNPPVNPLNGAPLDLSFSSLRSVSPVHLEYLRNMGVGASKSLSLVIGGKLWGLISCHHMETLYLDARVRAALELFAQVVSLKIHSHIGMAQSNAQLRARDIETHLVSAITAGGLSQLLSPETNVLDLIPAGGAALVIEGEITLLGKTPAMPEVAALTQWLDQTPRVALYATECLSDHYAQAYGFLEPAAGLLALPVSASPGSWVVWFLPELKRTVTWAGEPVKNLVHGQLGDRLTPRKSFAAWTELVSRRSRPWTPVELESAKSLSRALAVYRDIRKREKAERFNEMLKNIAVSANNPGPFNDILKVTLEQICKQLNWQVGLAYIWDDEERRLLPSACWYISPKKQEQYREFVEALATTEFETGIGVPGRVYESGAPLWIEDLWMEDLSKDEFFKSRKVRADGMQQSVLGLPILINGRVRYILEFFDEFKNRKDNVFLQMFQQQGREMISRVFERKLAEADLADYAKALAISNRELDEFAFVASHDLKAPLRVIDNASKWLEEDLREHLNDDMRENMGLLRGRVKRMDKLLDDLLAYSRAGRKTGDENEMISGVSLMDNILGLLSPPAGFTVQASQAFLSIQIHRMPLQQILLNLIGNAIKHHDKSLGSVDVTVDDKGAFYAFTVKDDGPGIAPQFHAKIFKLFQTLKPRDQVEGSGMGLAIVRKHIEACGGTIEVESDVGKGTIFRFTLQKSIKKLS